MYGWAPLAILGEEINKIGGRASGRSYTAVDTDDNLEPTSPRAESNYETMAASTTDNDGEASTLRVTQEKEEASTADAGIYLGIWNIYATIPQFLATFISGAVFSILEPGKSPELSEGGGGYPGAEVTAPERGLSGTGVCLAVGAVCSFVGAVLTFRLRRI